MVLIKILNLLRFRVLKFMFWVRLMSWLKCYELIVMGNGLIGWFLDDFVKNNDFEINWFNWCIGCKKLWKNPYWKY